MPAIEIDPSHDTRGGVVCHVCLERRGEMLARPCVERIFRSIANVARQMAGAIVVEGGSVKFAEAHAAAIERDLAKLKEML